MCDSLKSPRSTDEKIAATQTLARLKALQDEVKKLPVLDDRSENEILGYDENGTFQIPTAVYLK